MGAKNLTRSHLRIELRQITFFKTIPAIIMLCLCAIPVFAQQGRGTMLGTITDASGAVVAGARLTITNTATNAATTVTTNSDGYYLATSLPVGGYSVSATKEGFKRALRSGVTLEVDQKAEINLTLETGAVNEVIEVGGQGALVDTTTATFGKVIENRRVQELPLNGRNALSLVLLAPSVQSGAGPTASGFGDRGTQLSLIRINGSPLATNNFLVDGLSSTNVYVPDININPTVDAVQEFKVQTNTMSSEYGYTLGGVINLVTKSGTNDYHGTAYEFLRNDALDANTWTNNRVSRAKPPLRYNQFGGSIGGPIQVPRKIFGPLGGFDGRDGTFFFYNYEGYRFTTSATGLYSLPTEAFRRGDFSQLKDAQGNKITIYDPLTTRANPNGNGFLRDPFPNNIIPENRIDPVSRNILRFYPLPNRNPDNANSNLNNYFGSVANKRSLSQQTGRFDHRFSEKNSFSARYVYYRQFTDNGTANLYPDPVVRQRTDPFRGHNIVLSDVHSFTPKLIHEIRLGVARQIFDFKVASAGDNWPQQLGLPAIVPGDTFPAVNNGLPGFNTGTVGRRGGVVWQVFDSLTYLAGNHSLKFGTELRLIQANNLQKASPSGAFNFPTTLTDNASPVVSARTNTGSQFATFLLGTVGSASITTHLGESETGKAYSFYANDDWKVNRRLSVSLGLRYDYQQQPYERNCGTSSFIPFDTNPANGLRGLTEYACKDYGQAYSNNDGNDFAPRVGFSWDVFGSQKTVVRGGYAIFYPSVFSFYIFNLETTNGFASTSTAYNPPNGNTLLTAFQFKDGFPTAPNQPLGSALGPNLFATSNVSSFKEKNSQTPMSQQWNLSLQQQLPGGFLVEATYSANRGTHLLAGDYDLNQVDPALIREFGLQNRLTNQVTNPFAGKVPGQFGGATISQQQALRPLPYVGGVTVRAPHLGNSIYHALLVSGEKRFSQGFTLLASYTWGKLISDSIVNPINFVATEGANEFGYQNGLFNRRAERAEDPSNVPHRFVLSGLFELPIGKGKKLDFNNGFANQILGGWQFNTITTIVAGPPMIIRGANNGLANRPNWFVSPRRAPSDFKDPFFNPANDLGVLWFDPSTFLNPGLYSDRDLRFTYGNLSRSVSQLRNPGAVISDLSVIKTFSLTEKVKLQFRAEAFNAFNHTNLLGPNASFAQNNIEVTRDGVPVTVANNVVTVPAGTNPIIYGQPCLGASRTLKNSAGQDTPIYSNLCNTNISFGRITSARDPRQMQFGLKLVF